MHITVNPGGKMVLQLKDDLSVNRINDIQNQIESALSQSDDLIIKHDQNCNYDLTYMQLLLAAKKTANEENKLFRIELEESFRTAITNAGFNELFTDCIIEGV